MERQMEIAMTLTEEAIRLRKEPWWHAPAIATVAIGVGLAIGWLF